MKSGSFTIPTTGHDFSGNTRYRITLTVTDSNGSDQHALGADLPAQGESLVQHSARGLTVYLDGVAKTTPFAYDTLIGFTHTVEARNQTGGATTYTFGSWSDGGAQTHTIVVPTARSELCRHLPGECGATGDRCLCVQ